MVQAVYSIVHHLLFHARPSTMCNPRPRNIRAIIFDIGGVVVGSPIAGVNVYEREHKLPHNWLNVGITSYGESGAFQRFERSELDLYTFYERFGEELSDTERLNGWYSAFCKSRDMDVPSKLPHQHKVDGRELFGIMMVSCAGDIECGRVRGTERSQCPSSFARRPETKRQSGSKGCPGDSKTKKCVNLW